MTGRPFDADALPPGLNEADLLEWVEADARARQSATEGTVLHRVGRAVEADPQLAAALEAMRIDRAALGSLETPVPPPSLAQAVLEEHERQALLALSDMAMSGPRATQHRMNEDEPFTFSAFPRWFKPVLGIAALIAVAFGAWQLAPALLPGSGSSMPMPATGTSVAEGQADPRPTVTSPAESLETGPALAGGSTPSIVPPPEPLQPDAKELLVARLDMSYEHALEMAEAGRLMVVVSVDDLAPVEEAITSISARPVEATWRLDEPSVELIAALSEPAVRRPGGSSGMQDGPLFAEGQGPLGQLGVIMAAAPSVYLARVSTSPEALLSLLDAMESMGESARVVVTAKPLPSAGAVSTSISDEMALWWAQDPASWQPRSAIPVRFVQTQ